MLEILADEYEETEGNYHIIPLFGKRHIPSTECWCEPETLGLHSDVYVHHQEH